MGHHVGRGRLQRHTPTKGRRRSDGQHPCAYTLYSSQTKGYDCLIPIQVGDDMSKPTEKQAPKPVLRFFPEGGSIVEGATCMVAFEATTEDSDSLDVEGDIVDRQGKVVTRFQSYHRGMGFFPLKAETGGQYTAVCRDRGGRQYKFPLPPARQDAACLRCRVTNNDVEVRVNCGACLTDKPFFLLVHCRGQLVSLKQIQAGATYRLPLNLLPAGVNSLMLLDNNCHVWSERLVFSNNTNHHLHHTR